MRPTSSAAPAREGDGAGVAWPAGVTPLTDRHRAHLRTSGLSDAIITERGYLSAAPAGLTGLEGRFTKAQRRPGIVYPVHLLGHLEQHDPAEPWKAAHHWELRPDQPRNRNGKPAKYERPQGVPQVPDVLPRDRRHLTDPSVPLYITEGVKKADALADLGLTVVCLPGVYGYRTRSATDGAVTHPSLRDEVAWEGRRVVLAFDADRASNRQVAQALRRLANLIAGWGADVHLVHLPQHGDTKTGIDDHLAAFEVGDRLAQLHAITHPYVDGGALPPEKLGEHPETGAEIRNPSGYQGAGAGHITYTDARTRTPRVIYTGTVAVTETGRTLEGEERLTVRFTVGKGRTSTVTAPRSELVRARGVLDHLGAAGANVHDGNARDVARYLGEFASLNADALPRRTFTERLGVTPDGIIGPGWCVGSPATYTGPPMRLRVKGDRAAWAAGLREIGTWEPGAWLARVVVALTAAAPHLAQLGMLRNPVIGIGAPSNSGKGTLATYALSLYADPAHPLKVGAIRTRTTALLQVVTQLNGLPVWIDEAHQLDERTLTDGVYAFANRQTYTRGGKDGTARGGDPLEGFMLLTGEGLTDLTTTGTRNRVLIIDGTRHWPLGRKDAPERALTLERAAREGAGAGGQTVTSHLWEHRSSWAGEVHDLAERLVNVSPAWNIAAAAAEVTLRHAREALGLDADPAADGLAGVMLHALTEGWAEVDPAREAFERVRDLVNSARMVDGTAVSRDGGDLARVVSTVHGRVWAVRATAPDVEEALKRYGGPRVVGLAWRERGYVVAGAGGRSTIAAKLGANNAVRCYAFPEAMFTADADPDAAVPDGITTARDASRAPN